MDDSAKIFKAAVEKYGRDNQINMIREECAELINATCKYERNRCGLDSIIEEADDVIVTINQIPYIYGIPPRLFWEMLVEEYNHKVERLERRINDE